MENIKLLSIFLDQEITILSVESEKDDIADYTDVKLKEGGK